MLDFRLRCQRDSARTRHLFFEPLEARSLLAAVISVNSTLDSDSRDGELTLREAILISRRALSVADLTEPEQAFVSGIPTNSDTDTIGFNIPGPGVHTISPTSALPAIIEPVIIDGYTQPGASPNSNGPNLGSNAVLMIELNGQNASTSAHGLLLNGVTGATVRGLVINRFAQANVMIFNGSQNKIEGNFIGTDPTGMSTSPDPFPNFATGGIDIVASTISANNIVGGASPAARNLISGNHFGIDIVPLVGGGVIRGTIIQGNFVGTNAAGTSALGNHAGINFLPGSSGTIVGGSAAGEGNLISGNLFDGIALGGSQNGCGGGTYVGDSVGNLIQGNKIGTDVTGTKPLGNGSNGITIGLQSQSTHQVGGTTADEGNTIAFNGVHGVGLKGSHTAVLSNSVFSNGRLGIHLGIGCSALPNDPGDADTGPNNGQNFPAINSAVFLRSTLTVEYSVPSNPENSDYPLRVEFFAADATGQEGKVFLGFDTYEATEAGTTKTYSFTPVGPISAGHMIVATATDEAGNTSEFSGNVTVQGDSCSLIVTNTLDADPGSLREAITCANTTPNIDRLGDPEFVDPDPIIFNIPRSGVQTISINSPLPAIIDPVYIDGYTQPGSRENNNFPAFNGTLLIELSGASAGPANGLTITAGFSTVRGLVINRFNSFEGDPQVRGNGIFLDGLGNNRIEGNFLGTDTAGTAALPNFNAGVRIAAGQGDPSSNVIGGVIQQTRNIISGNGTDGIAIGGAASQTFVVGNHIGTQKDGVSPLGNGRSGVRLTDSSFNNDIGAPNSGAGNIIAYNSADGVTVASQTSTNNKILTNSIFSNGGLGIDLGADGVTPNDQNDLDDGANHLQNFPILTGVNVQNGVSTVVSGRLNSAPNQVYRIEIYSSAPGDLSGFGEGKSMYGSTLAFTDANGNASFSLSKQAVASAGRLFTATATFGGDSPSETSEFSPAICSLIVTNTLDSGLGSLREAITCANAVPNIDRDGDAIVDPDPITFAIPANDPRHFYYRNDGLNGGLKNLTVTTASDDATISNIDPDWRHSWYSTQIDTPLPVIDEAALIDGLSQFGASPNTAGLTEEVNAVLRIEVTQNATSAGSGMNAFVLGAGSSTIRGLVINRFDTHGMQVHSDGNTIAGCHIGSDVSATQKLGNGGDGIRINGRSGNLIGGTSAADRNYIRDNGDSGVALVNGATRNVVQGSSIVRNTATPSGSDQTKTAGVLIDEAPDNLIGGTLDGSGNGISGNDRGILIVGAAASGNIVQGNTVHGNQPGVYIRNAHDNIVGGTTPAARNFIFRNGEGVRIESNDPSTAAYNNVVLGNFIGLDSTGMATGFATLSIGVWILGPDFSGGAYHNTVGGLEEGSGNVISGDNHTGVRISGSLATENVIQGNLIGLAADGTTPLGNFGYGIEVFERAHGNTIGGPNPGSRNVISANRNGGLAITGVGVTGNLIHGNYIGTDATGTLDRGNLGDGIEMQDDASENMLRDNVVSGNDGTGIRIYRPGTSRNSILGNKIGTAADGISPLGNALNGVEIEGPSNTKIGGIELGSGNIIAFNGGRGVSVPLFGITAGTGNAILGNSIFSNADLGIDLSVEPFGPDGVTLNDGDDQDSGPNNLQNFPQIAYAIAATNVMRVSYLVASTPGNSTYPLRIEFFKADANGQGQIFLGSDTYSSADFATGAKRVTFATPIVVAPGDMIVATATDSSESGSPANTSEFSATHVTTASPWYNANKPLDVDGDLHIVASDALDIINYLNAFGSLPVPAEAADGPLFYDTNNDLTVSAADALEVINYLNAFGADGEGEPRQSQAASDLSISGNAVPLDHLFNLLALDLTHNARKNPRR